MGQTLREVIRETTARHLDAGHLVMGQCLTAVGWVGGTLPERQDMTEFPMSDVAQSGFVVGAALVGRRPIYVIRYQGFNWFNFPIVLNYAAKSKAIWGRPCPLLIRSIAMEGRIGPTSGSSHHAIAYRMPGVKIFSPMTPGEWLLAYEEFMAGDDVVLLSEHRGAYDCDQEFTGWIAGGRLPDIYLFPISITRFAAVEAAIQLNAEGISAVVCHLERIKPLPVVQSELEALARAGRGVVIDDDYQDGVAKAIANDLANLTGARVTAMGLEDRTAGFADRFDNLPPSAAKIAAHVRRELRRRI